MLVTSNLTLCILVEMTPSFLRPAHNSSTDSAVELLDRMILENAVASVRNTQYLSAQRAVLEKSAWESAQEMMRRSDECIEELDVVLMVSTS